MKKERIVIEITDSYEDPKVFVNGEEVNVLSIDYSYSNMINTEKKKHNLNLIMPDSTSAELQNKGIAFFSGVVNEKTGL